MAQQTGRKPLVILDEFYSVTQFDSFPNIKETLSVIGPILSQQIGVGYIIASSNTNEFCHKSLPEQLVTPEIIERLFEFTSGDPFYLNCLTTAMRRLYRGETSDDILKL